jgi:hypothetical protein
MPADDSARLEREIDRAVRSMLDVEAPALRHRVEARIRGAERLPRRPARLFWLAPIAAAVVVAIVVFLRPASTPRQAMPGPSVVGGVSPAELPGLKFRPTYEGGVKPGPPYAAEMPGLKSRPAYDAPAAELTVRIAAIPEPKPIVIAPIAGTRVRPSDIDVAALPDITPIAVEPLSPTRER